MLKYFFIILILKFLFMNNIDTRILFENNWERIEPSNLNETFYQTYRECLIHSRQYLFEYLTVQNLRNPYSIGNVYTMPLSYVRDFDNLRWSLIPAGQGTYRFYIRSLRYPAHFLCASASHKYLFKMRRVVQLMNLFEFQKFGNGSTTNLKNCQWRFDQVKARHSQNNTYIIWNVNYNEPLYTATSLLKEDNFKRNVFMWHQSPSKSNQFKWFMDCSKGIFLTI